MELHSLKEPHQKYFSLMAMLTITMMIIAMLFTYRVIKIWHFMTPGGVFIFAMSYSLVDIITEIYGYNQAQQVIWSTAACIIFFNLVCYLLINLPASNGNESPAYDIVFGHNLHLLFGFTVSFIISDRINAKAINHWKILLNGKYFWLRNIGSSAVGETIFGILAAALMYSQYMSFSTFSRVIISTWTFKVLTTIVSAYPSTIVVELLKRAENIESSEQFHSLSFEQE